MQKSRIIAAAHSLLSLGVPVALGWTKNEQGVCRCPSGAKCDHPGHHPMGGIYSATLSREEITARITALEFVPNLIIATGHPGSKAPSSTPLSPLIGVDLDYPDGLNQWLKLCETNHFEGKTPSVESGGHGYHLYFLRPPGVECIRSLSRGAIASHIELKADASSGLTAPPSIHHTTGKQYFWKVPLDTPFLVLPDFLWKPYIRRDARPTLYDPLPAPGTSTAYGLAALQSACDRVAAALPGSQEDTLNREALSIGNLVAGGELNEEEAAQSLLHAGQRMVNQEGREPWNDIGLTLKIQRALNDGKKQPRQAPPREDNPLVNALDRVINELQAPPPEGEEAMEGPMRETLLHREYVNHPPLEDPETPLETIALTTRLWPLDKIGLVTRLIYWRGANFLVSEGVIHHWNGKYWKTGHAKTQGSSYDALYCDADCLPDLLAAEIPLVSDQEGQERQRLMRRFSHDFTSGIARAAAARPALKIEPDQFDANPLLFNMNNGTFNLETGKLQPHSRADRISCISPVNYNPDAQCPKWLKYLKRIQRNHPDNIPYLQRLAGYTLRGDNPDQIIVLLLGEKSRNGKTVFLETLMGILGQYASPGQGEMMYADHKYEEGKILYELYRYRMVNFSEPGEKGRYGRRLNTPFLKKISGNDSVSVRAHYQHSTQARVRFKLWCGSNYSLHPDESAMAIWERLRIVGFHEYLPPEERILGLQDLLKEEYSGIFNWMIAGWNDYLEKGFQETADSIALRVRDIEEQNPMMGWMAECCQKDPDHFESTRALFQSYDDYAKESNLEKMTIIRFSRLIKSFPNIKEFRTMNIKGIKGLRITKPLHFNHFLEGDNE